MHLDLKSAGRSGHFDGLLGAGSEVQLNRVLGVPGGGLLNHGRYIQAVIAVKIHEVISDFGMIIRYGNRGPDACGEIGSCISTMRTAAWRSSAMKQANAQGQH